MFVYRNHLTYAVNSSVIQVVPEGAFTAERTVRVDADTVLADTRVIQALVHICNENKIMNPSSSLTAFLYVKEGRIVLQLHTFTSFTQSSRGSDAEGTQSLKRS